MTRFLRSIWPALLLVFSASGSSRAAESVNFSRDVLPVLSDRCFHCHGPDETHREADLRLDLRETAVADRGGYAAIVPEQPEKSELLNRVTSLDADVRMPPLSSHRKELSKKEIDTLRRWIASGAKWGKHWAFEKPTRTGTFDQAVNPVDEFVRRRLQEEKLDLAEEAPRHTLIRRLSFDLTGLPPSLEEVDAFLRDDSAGAYERVVDRLLQSPHYGERMAMWWLDGARYSDTDGFQQDETRTNWPWRDWVVRAFNSNMPFDQFTIEQCAGDLLPDATPEQILATCFHRNHMTNGEGGRDIEESRIDYVIDRVNTTGTVWLGLTLGCCQCHSHKFDPISHKDYYSLFSFFNSIEEDGSAGGAAKPYLAYGPSNIDGLIREAEQLVEQRKQVEAAARQQAERDFQPWLAEQISRVQNGFQPWRPLRSYSLESVEGTVLTQEPDGTIQASGPVTNQDDYRIVIDSIDSPITGLRLEVLPHASHTEGKLSRGARGEFILTDVKLQVHHKKKSQVRDIEIASAVADAEQATSSKNHRDYGRIKDTLDDDPRNGWTTESHDPLKPHVAVFVLAEALRLDADEQLVFVLLQRSTTGDANIGRFRVSCTEQPGVVLGSLSPLPLEDLAAAKAASASEVSDALRTRLLNQFLAEHEQYQQAALPLDRANRQLAATKHAGKKLSVMVLKERTEPRHTYVLERGVWDNKGQEVPSAVPAAILAWDSEATRTRLDLARWLVSRDNPLTARVIVNQLWQLCFGAGLVRTPDDFGLQGELPTHPELLDWLACELLDQDWDVKHILRLIVTSHTYRQNSAVSAELLARDPENRLLARGARFRLPSWMIRDAALRVSGLMNPIVGGPPIMPYQPDGVWEEMFMGRFRYEPSQGTAQYRRTLYAFWRRAIAPTFLFDSAQRRTCEVRPRRTNTPLHALTLLNDLSLLEASRALAQSVMVENDPSARLQLIARRALSRPATPAEINVLARELKRAMDHYQSNPGDAEKVLNFGQPELCHAEHPLELASYMVIASMVLNLDEAVTHE